MRLRSISHEAARSMCVKGQEEWNEEVVSIPKGLEGLLADAMVSRGIHHHHAEQHNVARDPTSFREMDPNRSLVIAKIVLFNIEETNRLERSE